jgi:hypothetical protein
LEVYKKVQNIEKRHEAVQVLAQALFTSDIVTEIPGYLPIFQKVCRGVSPFVDTGGQSWIWRP